MVAAPQIRAGMVIRHEGQPFKVVTAEYHPGQGKMGGVSHVHLKNLSTGTHWETSFRADLKFDTLDLDKRPMEYLYGDSQFATFMDPASYYQIEIPLSTVGEQSRLLVPQLRVSMEFLEGRPVSVELPPILEAVVTDTAPPIHASGQDSTWKPATLECGVSVMVPQFIKSGDSIRLDTTTLKYMDRVKVLAK